MGNTKVREFEIGDKVVFAVERLEDISHGAAGFALENTYKVDDVEYCRDYINIYLTNDDGNNQLVKSTDLRHADDILHVKEEAPTETIGHKFSLDKIGNICKLSIDGVLSREQIESIMAVVYCDE